MAYLSVSLGVLNLLPIPMLDGGHLVFFTIEAIRRRPVSERIQALAYRVGASLLFAMMAVAIFNDIARL
jgi:regulator of sigma E protease